jgi:uncharacterized membrane protein
MMIGTAFLMLAMVAILRERYLIGSLFLGLTISTNQWAFLALPIVAYYFWTKRKISFILPTALVYCAITLPYLISSPTLFSYDTLGYQLSRPFQKDGQYGLAGILNASLGWQIPLWIRTGIFLVTSALSLWTVRKNRYWLLVSIGVVLSIGVFVLPVNGFLNYFLMPMAIGCAIVPKIASHFVVKTGTRPNVLESPSRG